MIPRYESPIVYLVTDAEGRIHWDEEIAWDISECYELIDGLSWQRYQLRAVRY
jgi:hypothetical protein